MAIICPGCIVERVKGIGPRSTLWYADWKGECCQCIWSTASGKGIWKSWKIKLISMFVYLFVYLFIYYIGRVCSIMAVIGTRSEYEMCLCFWLFSYKLNQQRRNKIDKLIIYEFNFLVLLFFFLTKYPFLFLCWRFCVAKIPIFWYTHLGIVLYHGDFGLISWTTSKNMSAIFAYKNRCRYFVEI